MTRPTSRASLSILCVLAASTAGCSDPDTGGAAEPSECSIPSQNARVFSLMKDAYLWYSEVPDVDPSTYSSPDALLDALRYKKLDRWSYLSKKTADAAYYGEGTLVGLGLRMRHDSAGFVRVALVYEGSPAGDAGLRRGDTILTLNGETTADIDANGSWDSILGEDKEGVPVAMTLADENGQPKALTLVKRPFQLTTVAARRIIHRGDRAIGYLYFDRFITPAEGELKSAFQWLTSEGAEDLILDLRYNGGGLIDVALALGGLIGGARTEGERFSELLYNDRHLGWGGEQIFEKSPESLDLARVFIITTSSTASASELLINGLRPFLGVTLVGDATHGKPVGMDAWPVCDLVAHPVSFRMLNADGEGDYFQGLGPDCYAGDDFSAPLGDETEASLAEALNVLQFGACSVSSGPPASSAGTGVAAVAPRSSTALPLRGFSGEIGAF